MHQLEENEANESFDSDETSAGPQDSVRAENLGKAFVERFGEIPDFVARAPGRINLIGEHTDYNGGFVLPVAINRSTLVAGRVVSSAEDKGQIELISRNYNVETFFDPHKLEPGQEAGPSWSNYSRGVVWSLREKGLLDLNRLPSAQLMIDSNVPQGAGLSSSAALEVATALALYSLAGFRPDEIDRAALALACQKAENDFVGVKCGIMDQFISALGQSDAAVLIDTRSLGYRAVPLGFQALGLKLVAVNSAVPHSLKTSAYNERRSQCEEAARLLAVRFGLPEDSQLRDISLTQLEEAAPELPPLLFKRARHVIGENGRVLKAVNYLENGFGNAGDLAAFGQLLNESHASLRDDYAVSVPEVDLLVELAQQQPGVIGARMTGGGFGGCTVNIVAEGAIAHFRAAVVEQYRRQTGLPAQIYIFEGVEGGTVLR